MLAALCFGLLAVASQQAQVLLELEEGDRPPTRYEWPPFENWDCTGVNQGVLDWDRVYSEILAGLQGDHGQPDFMLSQDLFTLLYKSPTQAFEECPLGTLYLIEINTYAMLSGAGDQSMVVDQAEQLVTLLRSFPVFLIGGSRWPVFEAFHHFRTIHEPTNERAASRSLCNGIKGQESGIDWDQLLKAAGVWGVEMIAGYEPGQGSGAWAGEFIKDVVDRMAKDPERIASASQDECPLGFLFICTTQALAAALRKTGQMEAWARAVDKIMGDLPFFLVAGSRWPTFQVLAMFSSYSKGDVAPLALGGFQQDIHRWGGAHPSSKRFRNFGDLRLTKEELAPFGLDQAGWEHANQLAALDPNDWYERLVAFKMQKHRKIFNSALDGVVRAVISTTFTKRRECGYSGITSDSCVARGCQWSSPSSSPVLGDNHPACLRESPKRKVVGVSFVWGETWAKLVPKFVAWVAKLGMPVVLVAMGDACRNACEIASEALGGWAASGVACWDPLHVPGQDMSGKAAERGSILQRHAIVHLLLHLGVDALAFDFDTFWFADPRRRLEEIAEASGADVLMTRHLDADCFNMGLLYVRASSQTAQWYSQYLAWLHIHPYEREQRGANALLRFTKQDVAFAPKDMPKIKAVPLDDTNEFASSRGGWLGDWSRILFFHWVNPSVTMTNWHEIKVTDLRAVYDGALHHAFDLNEHGGSLAKAMAHSEPGSFLRQVRGVLDELVVKEPPHRQACW